MSLTHIGIRLTREQMQHGASLSLSFLFHWNSNNLHIFFTRNLTINSSNQKHGQLKNSDKTKKININRYRKPHVIVIKCVGCFIFQACSGQLFELLNRYMPFFGILSMFFFDDIVVSLSCSIVTVFIGNDATVQSDKK